MIEVKNNIATIDGTAKELCRDFTHILVHLINVLENVFELSREESRKVIDECINIAYMNDDERAKFLSELEELCL